MYEFYYDNGRIKYIILVESERITYHLVSFARSKSQYNNESYGFKQSIYEININITMETKYYQ